MALDQLHTRPILTKEPRLRRLDAAQLRARHPDEPWRWRPAWASGVIRCSHARTAAFAWGAAVFWNLLSVPLLWAIPQELADGNRLAAIGLLFPVIGFGLVIVAIRETLRWRRFGRSDLVLDTLPGVIGGRFAGTVQLEVSVGTDGAFEATLSCLRIRISGTGKSRRRTEHLLWQEEQHLEAAHCGMGPRGTAVPIAFSIPADSHPSSPEPGRDIVEWRLDVRAAMPGIDYQARFVVPVFRTEARASASPDPAARDASDRRAAPLPTLTADGAGWRFSASSRIRVQPHPPGGTLLWFPAFRNPKSAIALTLFAVLWLGITAVLIRAEDIPILFPAAFGFFAVLLVWGAFRECFRSVRVEAKPEGVTIRSRTLLWPGRRHIAAGDIERIEAALRGHQNLRARYDVLVHTRGGRHHSAGEGIGDKREAEWLAAEMERAVRGESVEEQPVSA